MRSRHQRAQDRAVGLCAALALTAASIAGLGSCDRQQDPGDAPVGQQASLARRASGLLPTLLDFLVTSRLADATAAMALEAAEYRLLNRTLSPDHAWQTYRLLGRAHAYEQHWDAAAEAFGKAARHRQDERSRALARALKALAAGGTPDLADLDSAGAAQTFHCLTRLTHLQDPAGVATSSGGESLEQLYLTVLADETFTPRGDPVGLLASFAGEESVEFSYYDPLAFRFLARIYLRLLRHDAGEDGREVLALLENGAAASNGAFEPGSLEDDVVYLILATHAGKGVDPSVRERLEQAYDERRPPLERDMVHGYLALAAGEVEQAYVSFAKVAQIDLPPRPREDFTSILLLDFVPLSYRVHSINYARRWILGAREMQEAFPYLEIPYFFLTWMQREGLLN